MGTIIRQKPQILFIAWLLFIHLVDLIKSVWFNIYFIQIGGACADAYAYGIVSSSIFSSSPIDILADNRRRSRRRQMLFHFIYMLSD